VHVRVRNAADGSDDIVGGTPQENARDIIYVLKGEKGPKRDIIVINTAAALYVSGLTESLKDAIPLAEETIDSGRALEKLDEFRNFV